MKNKLIIIAGAAAMVVAANVQADPIFQYSIDGGATWISAGNGIVNVTDGTWDIKTLGGSLTGSASSPNMDLSTLDVSGSGTLMIEESVTGLGPSSGGVAGHLNVNDDGGDTVDW